MKQSHFEHDKHSKQVQEASLFLQSDNPILAINVYFNMLRLNSNLNQYKEIWNSYLSCVRIVLADFAVKSGYVFKDRPDFLLADYKVPLHM